MLLETDTPVGSWAVALAAHLMELGLQYVVRDDLWTKDS